MSNESGTIVLDFNGNAYVPKEEITVKSAASDGQKYAIYNASELIEFYTRNGYKISKLFFIKREWILYLFCRYYFKITFIKKEEQK